MAINEWGMSVPEAYSIDLSALQLDSQLHQPGNYKAGCH